MSEKELWAELRYVARALRENPCATAYGFFIAIEIGKRHSSTNEIKS